MTNSWIGLATGVVAIIVIACVLKRNQSPKRNNV